MSERTDYGVNASRLKADCIACMLREHIGKIPQNMPEKRRVAYAQDLLRLIADADLNVSAPELSVDIHGIQENYFGPDRDYRPIRKYYDELLMREADRISRTVSGSADPLYSALQYSMAGNYIDFGVPKGAVSDEELMRQIEGASRKPLDRDVCERLRKDLSSARTLVLLADNCGEIVLDQILVRTIRRLYGQIETTVIVRGRPVVNDATLEDAEWTHLEDCARVIGSGSGVGGTVFAKISGEAREALLGADVILAKGQGNFETFADNGLNAYYLFMVKCPMFVKRFGKPLHEGILIHDSQVGTY